ncbi:MAG: ABC transporter ATP-binding protein [Alphaproteobacteria bacterium]|nr:ABC transporter ATP-binding protein [Alphaproteobacteria bacterium]
MGAITISGLGKSFGTVEVLKDVSLDIADGEFLTLLGPSGCGKSTLLRIIAGLERQTAGSIAIDGRAIDGLPAKARNIAMVFQSYALYPHLTAARNIALPLTMRRMTPWQRLPLVGSLLPGTRGLRAAIGRDVAGVAAALDIAHLLDRKPGQLSGGQKQRVALARAMVRQPAAFLLDEPLSNLDAKLRVQMRAELTDLHRRLATTMIYVTHDQAEAMTMSDRVAVLMGGDLLQVGPPRRIYDDPETLQVAEFVGSPKINVLPGRMGRPGLVDCLGARLPLGVPGGPDVALRVAVRPEALVLARPDAADCLRGRVRHIENLGSDCMVHADVEGAADPVVVRLDPEAGGRLARGTPIALEIPPHRALVFDAEGKRLRPDAATARLRRAGA